MGTIGRHLLSAEEANPGNPALCLSVSQASQVMPGTSTCGPNGENDVYTTAPGPHQQYPRALWTLLYQ